MVSPLIPVNPLPGLCSLLKPNDECRDLFITYTKGCFAHAQLFRKSW